MVLFNMYIFNRYGDSIYYCEWNRSNAMQEGEASLIAGFVYTLQHISTQLAPDGNGSFRAVRTPCYKLHYYETMTGYRAALLTDPSFVTAVAHELMADIFREVFLDTVVRNPTYRHEEGVTLSGTEFGPTLQSYLKRKQFID